MDVVASPLIGALVGWLASLFLRAATNEAIVLDIAIGVAGGVALAQLLGNSTVLDSSLAGGLGALVAVGILELARRIKRRNLLGDNDPR